MRLHYSIFLASIFILTQLNLIGQVKSNKVKEAILNADTVLLVSHNLTEQKIVEDKPGGGVRKSPPIVLRGRPNKKIIHETVLLNSGLKNQLISILTQPNNDGEMKAMQCFLPHHSILLIKGGKTSFIEICFACQNLVTSNEIGTSDINYPKIMWKQLETFFKSQGIKYQIPFNYVKE